MMRPCAAKYLILTLFAGLLVWGTSEAYRAYVNHWQGDLRAPLILGSLAGIAFIISGSCLVSRSGKQCEEARARDSLGR